MANWLNQNCANGMSWLLKKSYLEEVGGLEAFSDYLAEDFFIAKALWSKYVSLAKFHDSYSSTLLLTAPIFCLLVLSFCTNVKDNDV